MNELLSDHLCTACDMNAVLTAREGPKIMQFCETRDLIGIMVCKTNVAKFVDIVRISWIFGKIFCLLRVSMIISHM